MRIEWTTIIAAILALIGSSSIINLLFQEFLKPNINSEMILAPNFQSARIEVANIGSKLASNLSTIVIAPENITSVKNLFSPSGLKIAGSERILDIGNIDKDINNNVLQFSISNLVQGQPSKIVLSISFLENKTHPTNDYNISSFYDQGSFLGTIKKSEPQLYNITGFKDSNDWINYFLKVWIPPKSIIPLFAGASVAFLLPKLWTYLKLRKHRKDIFENVMSLRYSIQFEPERFSNKRISDWLSKTTEEKLSLFQYDKCILLDDFYGRLNVYCNNIDKLNKEDKKRLENEIVGLANKILIKGDFKQKIYDR